MITVTMQWERSEMPRRGCIMCGRTFEYDAGGDSLHERFYEIIVSSDDGQWNTLVEFCGDACVERWTAKCCRDIYQNRPKRDWPE